MGRFFLGDFLGRDVFGGDFFGEIFTYIHTYSITNRLEKHLLTTILFHRNIEVFPLFRSECNYIPTI